MIDEGRLLIEDGSVRAAGPRESVTVPDDATRIDHRDATAIPGLIDAHLHLSGGRSMEPLTRITESSELGAVRATADLRSLLAAGFTAVRDVGSDAGLALREAVAAGEIPGPQVFTSGNSISQTGGHGDMHMLPLSVADSEHGVSTLADGQAECRKAARSRIREGVDLLKIMTTGGVLSEVDEPDQSQFTDTEIQAFTEEASRVGIPVASHAQGAPGVKAALENGVDTIEHGFYLDEECLSLFEETGATFVPTLSIMERIVSVGEEHGVPDYGLRKARAASEEHYESTRRAYEAGVPIALGTDFIGPDLVPHGNNAMEAELFVERVGMSEQEAIEAGTRVAARTVAADDIGQLAPGYRADVVVFEDDPLEDITRLRDPDAVYKAGNRVTL